MLLFREKVEMIKSAISNLLKIAINRTNKSSVASLLSQSNARGVARDVNPMQAYEMMMKAEKEYTARKK